MAQSNSSAYTLAVLPGLNHLFQHSEKCTVTEYGSIEETSSPAALFQLTEWVAKAVSTLRQSRFRCPEPPDAWSKIRRDFPAHRIIHGINARLPE